VDEEGREKGGGNKGGGRRGGAGKESLVENRGLEN